MYLSVLDKIRKNRKLTYQLVETRNKVLKDEEIKDYVYLFESQKNIDYNSILIKVREEIKKEILESIIKKAKKQEVYVLGHNNPDADSIFSSYLLSNILNKLNIKAHFAILKDNYTYCNGDKKLIQDYLKEQPIMVDNIKDKKFILVDHNHLDGLVKKNVIGAIDHHTITNEIYDTLEMEYASTGLLIYDLFKNQYSFSEYEKQLIALTVFADTEYLCSPRFTKEDEKLLQQLHVQLDVKQLQQKYFFINNFEDTIEHNLKMNYKEYDVQGKQVCRTLIYSYNKEYEDYFDTYVTYLKTKQESWLMIWANYENKETTFYYEGDCIKLDYILTSTHIAFQMLGIKNEKKYK